MSYELKLERRPGYHYFYVTGTDDFETSLAYAREVFDACRRDGVSRLLVEEDLEGDLTNRERFDLANRLSEIQMHTFLKKIAFVDRREEQWQGNSFLETLARNRGLLARLFRDAKTAEAWILSGED